MRKAFMLAAVLAAVVFPTASHAGFTLGFRSGYAAAMGDGAKDQPLDDVVTGQWAWQVDPMWRINPNWAIGGYLSYGFGFLSSSLSDECDLFGADCSVSSLRLGIQGTYTITQLSPKFVPWVGLGIGWESLTQEVALSGLGSVSQDATGWEYLNLQAGCDYQFSRLFGLGLFAMYSMGEYTQVESEDIPETAMHQWLQFGVRGKFDFGAK